MDQDELTLIDVLKLALLVPLVVLAALTVWPVRALWDRITGRWQ